MLSEAKNPDSGFGTPTLVHPNLFERVAHGGSGVLIVDDQREEDADAREDRAGEKRVVYGIYLASSA